MDKAGRWSQEGLAYVHGALSGDQAETPDLAAADSDPTVAPAVSDDYAATQARLNRHAALIAKLRSDVNEALALREAYDDAPTSTLNPFGSTKSDVDADFRAVLDEIEAVIFEGGITSAVDRIDAVENRQQALRREIANLREERYIAPESSLWSKTKADIDEEIARKQEQIAIREAEIARIKQTIAARFEEIGVDLSPEQIEVLLTRIDGDDIIGMTVMVQTLAQMTEALQKLMQENSESLDYSRRYYGTALILRELVVHAQRQYIAKVDEIWLGRLDAIEADLSAAIAADQEQVRVEQNPDRRRIFQANIEQNRFSLEVIAAYRQALIEQRTRVAEAMTEAMRDVAAAYSTYKTVSLSSVLLDLVETTQTEFLELMQIQIPEIVPFESPEIEEKFRQITNELRPSS